VKDGCGRTCKLCHFDRSLLNLYAAGMPHTIKLIELSQTRVHVAIEHQQRREKSALNIPPVRPECAPDEAVSFISVDVARVSKGEIEPAVLTSLSGFPRARE
jgi:hypothetical protein